MRAVSRTSPDGDGLSYPLVRVPWCTCAGWGAIHEQDCGLEIADDREFRVFIPSEES